MSHSDRAVQVGGTWLAIASFLMVFALGLHGPIPPDVQGRMAKIAGSVARWSGVHWVAATALSLYAMSGLILLTSRSRLTDGWWRLTAWGAVCVGCLWTVTTAVTETTVLTQAALAGNEEAFAAWWGFAEGKAHGFAFFALAVAVVAGAEAGSPARATPAWSAWLAVAAGIGSFAGWALGMWLGVAPASLLWVASSIIMCAWMLWFGVGLTRDPGAAVAVPTGAGAARATPRGQAYG